jgi:hypothetical protein
MRLKLSVLTSFLAVLGAISAIGPASAFEDGCRAMRPGEDDSPIVCREKDWFHAADIPAGNVGALKADATPSWSTTPPGGSQLDGEGGAAIAETYFVSCFDGDRCLNDIAFEGTFTGNIDSIAISLHSEEPLWARCVVLDNCEDRDEFRTVLTVDEHVLYDSGTFSDSVQIDSTTTSQRRDFALVGLYDAIAAHGLAGSDVTHSLRLRIMPHNSHPSVVYLYDSTDYPSGLVFNPSAEELAGYEVVN